ncbi:MAG: ribose-5-phosphate isomerase RpiA [Hyphomicrobiales bacterium]|nr:ribose-5-phosphate isomerase RpiA [Hyphomicrobiales bacterium]
MPVHTQDAQKQMAAARALELVSSGMKVGLGTGSTAAYFVDLLAERARSGLDIICVPTSEATRERATRAGLHVATLDEVPRLDLTVDGADEVDHELRLIKGGGGALLREKIVAYASARMVVIADRSKLVKTLGAFPLPIEVVPFGLAATRIAIEAEAARLGLVGRIELRKDNSGQVFHTDSGNFILDAAFGAILDPVALSSRLGDIPGIVEHGLFIGIARGAIIAGGDDLAILGSLD